MTEDFNNIPFIKAKHYGKGRKKKCSLLVLHYTAQGLIDNTVEFFKKTNPAKASTHFIISRDIGKSKRYPGGIVQMVKLSDRSWHAGRSSWKGQRACNHFSVGIEFCNYGFLTKTKSGFKTWNNTPYPDNYLKPEFINNQYWEPFTEFQYHAGAWLCMNIMNNFIEITPNRIVGHSNVAPGRKVDPGPAFDFDYFLKLINQYKEVHEDD